MISYVKLYGPPVYDAVKALEKMAIDMPEVCIMDTMIEATIPSSSYGPDDRMGGTPLIPGGASGVYEYFRDLGEITMERCSKIISSSGEELGEYDFYFKWFTKPSMNQLEKLIKLIDETLAPLGVRYTITSK